MCSAWQETYFSAMWVMPQSDTRWIVVSQVSISCTTRDALVCTVKKFALKITMVPNSHKASLQVVDEYELSQQKDL